MGDPDRRKIDKEKGLAFLRFALFTPKGLLILAAMLVLVALVPTPLKVAPVMGGVVVLLRAWGWRP